MIEKKKILIADDDTGILEAMQMLLEDAEYEVETTRDGQTVQDLKDNLPDVLLLDIWMSGMDGVAICQHLKSQDSTKHLPIILCSANKDTQRLAKGCGADDFLAKPFEMMDLLDKVKKQIR
jgi:DNA-binding response OmpR family regulator